MIPAPWFQPGIQAKKKAAPGMGAASKVRIEETKEQEQRATVGRGTDRKIDQARGRDLTRTSTPRPRAISAKDEGSGTEATEKSMATSGALLPSML
ncbi:MAG: hypothetical protein RL489_2902 [Pseudomonadota bacterium]